LQLNRARPAKIVARPHRGRARHVYRGIDSHEGAVIFCRPIPMKEQLCYFLSIKIEMLLMISS